VGKIILKNSLSLFNVINLALAAALLAVGSSRNTLFLFIVLANTAMGIFQEIRSKKTLDKLSILNRSPAKVLRGGEEVLLPQSEVVRGDTLLLEQGMQVCADGVLQSGYIEADESLLTGESDRIAKRPGSKVMSGSFVTGGRAEVSVEAVGEECYAVRLTRSARRAKKTKSRLLDAIRLIIRTITVLVVPLGLWLFYTTYGQDGYPLREAVEGAATSMQNTIPEGLVLLTGVTLTVGAMALARRRALVQSLPCIETLARADVLCLDKTGTITDGTMTLTDTEPLSGSHTRPELMLILSELMSATRDNNATASAIRSRAGSSSKWRPLEVVPFSSERKWSGASFRDKGTFVLGAPEYVLASLPPQLAAAARERAETGLRVLLLAHSPHALADFRLPPALTPAAFVLLSDTIRHDAAATFAFFVTEGVTLKVISGDHPATVSAVALRAGIPSAEKYVDMSAAPERIFYEALSEEYTVFGRVSPDQKKALVAAMQRRGHTVCMTGDGVNDIPAMRQSDCSVSMVTGSDAARSACDFVLMASNFSAMKDVLREGRRVINNIEKVASLYLVKVIYSLLLALIYIPLPFRYPFTIAQLQPANLFAVGIPTFFLALEPNFRKPAGLFFRNVLLHAAPAAFTVVCSILYVQAASFFFELPHEESSSMCVFLIAVVCFGLLVRVTKPLRLWHILMFSALALAYLLTITLVGDFFMLESLLTPHVFFYLPPALASYKFMALTARLFAKIADMLASLFEGLRSKSGDL
jgi:cation-transporting ATPase E